MLNLAYVFPGQGSQTVGMLADLAEKHTAVRDIFAQASDVVGYDLWQLVQIDSADQLNQTEYTQIAVLTADVAVFSVIQQYNTAPVNIMAGHSLGEYAALVCAQAISLKDAVALVRHRGRLMQTCMPIGYGSMAAIVGLTDDEIEILCQNASNDIQQVTPANFNALGQVVIAGHAEAVGRAIALAQERQVRLAKLLAVSVPCHCPLLAEAAEEFAEYLNETNFQAPEIAVISNVDLSCYQSPQHIRALLKNQLVKPVRWVETIQTMRKRGINMIIECGPGKILTGLVKRIDKSLSALSVHDEASLQHAYKAIQ